MNMQSIVEVVEEAQEPCRIPTPIEIRTAIWTVLVDDAENPETQHVPIHVMGLVREAFDRANAGEFK